MMTGRVEHEELELAHTAHQLAHRGQAGGRVAQFAMHGRQRRKDRCELTRHAAHVRIGCREEEVAALVRVADATQQIFEAVHDAQATRRAASFRVTAALERCD